MSDFLLEIGCEEIPARMLDSGAAELGRRVAELLVAERLTEKSEVEIFSTPRRLAVLARGIRAAQPDLREQVLGPSTKVAFKDGKPTPAADAFAKKVGLDSSKLDRVTTPKGEYLSAQVTRKGRAAAEVLAERLPAEVLRLYWPKSMYWRGKNAERFVRPVRWLVAMLDGAVIPLELAGARAAAASRGHRTLSSGPVNITSPSAYVEALEKTGVLASRAAREQKIRKVLDAATRAVSGARWREDAALLSTVVNLTEFPSALLGNFDHEFLALPEEVLVTVMRDHQKYFAIEGTDGKLAPHFLAVLNTDSDPDGAIRHGHERVLRARFSDARFFWEADQKHSMYERVEMLKHVTFQKQLGTYYDKTKRVEKLATNLAAILRQVGIDANHDVVYDAANLAKADLTTDLVKEFTELQGMIGGLYVRKQGLHGRDSEFLARVADAIYDHYKPEFMEDSVPRTIEGAVLSIADKADSIAGMFALGLQPTGSKDPFALRRQANGIIKTLAEHKLPLKLGDILKLATEGYPQFASNVTPIVAVAYLFFRERLEFYLREFVGFRYDVVRAVMAASAEPSNVVETIARARAVSEIVGSEDFLQVAIGFKRIRNIISQAKAAGDPFTRHDYDAKLLQEEAEKALGTKLPEISALVEQMRSRGDFAAGLREISKLRPLVDGFFDKVMVMVPDADLRNNRLALLSRLLTGFSTIADFSEIVTEGKS